MIEQDKEKQSVEEEEKVKEIEHFEEVKDLQKNNEVKEKKIEKITERYVEVIEIESEQEELEEEKKERREENKEIRYSRIFKVNKERNKHKEDDEDSEIQFISSYTPINSQIQRGERGSFIKMEHSVPIPFYYPVMIPKNIERMQRVQDQPRKIQRISETMDILPVRSDEVDSQINHSTFDLDLVNRYTRKNLFIELIKMHNSKNYEDCECLGLNRNQQKEFITLLMRYGLKDNSIEPLYSVAESMKDSKKKMTVSSVSKETFVMYGKSIIEFIEFLMLDSHFRSTPHFILNGNTAQNVKY